MLLRAVLSFLACWKAVAEQTDQYHIVVDCGSTGSRLYVMHFTSNGTAGSQETKVDTSNVGKKKPGLSSYVANPENAVPHLLELFTKARKIVPEDRWKDTTVNLLGTAGMRSLKPSEQQIVWDGVKQGLISSDGFVFGKDSTLLQLRTVSGEEEGTWVMLTGNALTGRLNFDLTPTDKGLQSGLLGVIDLGGSSTQIAAPSALELQSGMPVVGQPGFAMVRSYAAFGMEQMRERIMKLVSRKGSSSSPCDFQGYQDPHHGHSGAGNAKECRAMMQEVFASQRSLCTRGDLECLPGAVDASQAGSFGLEFFAVSGYKFVTDFVAHWSSHYDADIKNKVKAAGNRMTIDELEVAADALCGLGWHKIEQASNDGSDPGKHRYTDITKAPHRCLEANYVASLLRLYGFPVDKRLVSFEDEVDGNDVEWPLGALLTMRLDKSRLDGAGTKKEL